jgi:hypothetical protein
MNICIVTSKRFEFIQRFYLQKLGFELENENPQACVFKYNHGQASFAVRTPLEPIENKSLGIGISIWFAVNENVEKLKEKFISNGITNIGDIMSTPFGRAFHVQDIDGYKLTFLETK